MKARRRRVARPVIEEALPLFVVSLLGLVGATGAGLSGALSPWASGFLVGIASVVAIAAAGLLSEDPKK